MRFLDKKLIKLYSKQIIKGGLNSEFFEKINKIVFHYNLIPTQSIGNYTQRVRECQTTQDFDELFMNIFFNDFEVTFE